MQLDKRDRIFLCVPSGGPIEKSLEPAVSPRNQVLDPACRGVSALSLPGYLAAGRLHFPQHPHTPHPDRQRRTQRVAVGSRQTAGHAGVRSEPPPSTPGALLAGAGGSRRNARPQARASSPPSVCSGSTSAGGCSTGAAASPRGAAAWADRRVPPTFSRMRAARPESSRR